MVMQCKRSEIRLFLMMKRAFILCALSSPSLKTRDLKVGNVRRRLSVFDGQIPLYFTERYIFESSDGENKRTPRGLLKPL